MEKHRQIKVFINPADHDRLRLAAALRKTTMADFCRQVVVNEANRLVSKIQLPEETRTLGM